MKLNESGGHIIKVKFLAVGEARVSTTKGKESSSTYHVSAVQTQFGHPLEEGCQKARFGCGQWPHKCTLSSPLRPERLVSVLSVCRH